MAANHLQTLLDTLVTIVVLHESCDRQVKTDSGGELHIERARAHDGRRSEQKQKQKASRHAQGTLC